MCRKWSGGIYLALEVAPDAITFEGADKITTYPSSDWAERGFCSTCGGNLYYRFMGPGTHHGTYHVGMGSLDDPAGISVTEEIFVDHKPEGYALAGQLNGMTEAEVLAMFTDTGAES